MVGSYYGSEEEAYRIFDARIPGWKNQPKQYYVKVL